VTIKPQNGATEVWSFVNLAMDWHPMHIHLFPHQLLYRRSFDVAKYQAGQCVLDPSQNGTSCYTGPPVLASGADIAWKDTTQAPPGQVTTVAIQFKTADGADMGFDPRRAPGTPCIATSWIMKITTC